VSQTDSFIEEVTEEVRRDRLYALARRYGWIVALVIFSVVAGAGFVEWQKARDRAVAQALGDRMFASLESASPLSRSSALEDIDAVGVAAALVKMLEASELATTNAPRAGDLLKEVAADATLPAVYRDIATLKLVMLRDYPMFSDARIAVLEPLTEPGAPFRLMALEQMALLHVERGETTDALDRLRPILNDSEASLTQRQRAQQIFVVLGGDLEGA
jgi:hypothetical protein